MTRATNEITPSRCPNGHALSSAEPTRGWFPCWCTPAVDGRHGHRTYRCRECGAVTPVPAHLTGPIPTTRGQR